MQLTQFTDYSLRVLMHLARLPEPGLATVPEIAGYHGISRNHLVKVVHHLAQRGLIVTTRGKGGGIQLARPAQTISVGEVVRLTEPHLDLVECFDLKTNQCRYVRSCFLQTALYEARRAFLVVLDRYTLSDAVANDRGSGAAVWQSVQLTTAGGGD